MRTIRKTLSDLSLNKLNEIKFFLDSNFSTVFHEPDFNGVIAEVFNTVFSYNLVYNKDGRLVALCPLHSIKDSLLIRTYSNPAIYEVPYGGWIYDDKEISLRALMEQIQPSITEELTYWSLPQIEDKEYLNIKNKRKYQTAIIDLETSEEKIWQNYINTKRRNMIRKAQRHNISIETIDYKGFEDYYQLMNETYRFTDLKTKLKQYYTKILKEHIPKNKAIILMAKIKSTFLSGSILLRNKHICHYWQGASKKDVDNLGQGELLQWEAIKWAKRNGSRYYDLCVVEPERLPNIARFKLGFSKNVIPFYCINKRNIGYRIVSRLRRCF